MDKELINKLSALFLNITKKLEKRDQMPLIQQEYDELIEFIDKLTILTNEEFEQIDNAINEYNAKLKKSQEQINLLLSRQKSDKEKMKSLQEKILKNSNLEEQFKILNEDLNKLKQKDISEKNEITNYQLKVKNNELLINDLTNEINKVKQDIFEKEEKIKNYEQEIKEKDIKISENTELIDKLTSENSELSKSNEEFTSKYTEQKNNYESKIKILEKQLKHLSDANNNFVQENNEVQTQLKDFQMLTNMAKVSAKKLNKQDFSILEVMSNSAEAAENEVQKLLSYIDELKALNKDISYKIKPLEDYALLQIKHDHEISIANSTLLDIQNKIFSDEEQKEIFKLKNDPNELFQALIKLKTENLELHKHIKDITIECNQQLREARWKNK